MIGENEYERLKRLGYTEEEIEYIQSDPISSLKIGEAPVGPNREDKSVYVKDSQGHTMRTSNIMLGYNRHNISLDNGEYASLEELADALVKYVTEQQDGRVIVCKSTGKIVDVSAMCDNIRKLLSEDSLIQLHGQSKAISNQSTMTYTLGKSHRKGGVFMLGKLSLGTGDYVSMEEFREALQDYVYMSKPKEQEGVPIHSIPTENTTLPPDTQSTVHLPVKEKTNIPSVRSEPVVTIPSEKSDDENSMANNNQNKNKKKVKKKRWYAFVPLLVATAIIASIGVGGHFTKNEEQDVATYVLHQMDEQVSYKTVDQMIQDTLSTLKSGDTVYIPAGQYFHHESDQVTDVQDTFGNPDGLREAGNYVLEYFSVLHNGQIQNVTYQPGVSLSDMLDQTAQQLGVPREELTVMGHAVTEDGKIAGWVNVEDAVRRSIEEQHKQVVDSIDLVAGEKFTGTVNGFDGTISIDSQGETVTMSLTDSAGDLLDEGDYVFADNGETYRVDNISVSTENVETNTIDIAGVVAAGAIGATGLAATYALNKKKTDESSESAELAEMLDMYNGESVTGTLDNTRGK